MVAQAPIRISFPPRRRLAVVDGEPLPEELRRVSVGLDRAREQVETLHNEIQQWHGENKIAVKRHSSLDLRTHRWTVQIPAAPLDRWGVLVGEVFHNLRSSLDRTVYAGAEHVTGEQPPPDAGRLAFPVATSLEAFESTAKSRLRAFAQHGRQEVIDVIERMQPYHDGEGGLLDAEKAAVQGLGLLSDLNNKDKHQKPHVVQFSAPASTAEYTSKAPVVTWTAVIGPVENGTEVGKVELAGPDLPSIHFDSGFVVSVLRMPLYGPSMLAALHGVATEAVYGLARVIWRES